MRFFKSRPFWSLAQGMKRSVGEGRYRTPMTVGNHLESEKWHYQGDGSPRCVLPSKSPKKMKEYGKSFEEKLWAEEKGRSSNQSFPTGRGGGYRCPRCRGRQTCTFLKRGTWIPLREGEQKLKPLTRGKRIFMEEAGNRPKPMNVNNFLRQSFFGKKKNPR